MLRKPFIALILSHCLEKNNNGKFANKAQRKEGRKKMIRLQGLVTLFNKSFPLGSIMESCLKASSPTKQISCPSYKSYIHGMLIANITLYYNSINNNNINNNFYNNRLTGSAKITTSTVAFPGVSRLTKGVRIFWFSFFIRASISGS